MAKIFLTSGILWAGVVTDGADITVECIGGGGGGRHAGDSGNIGTGGGGGAYSIAIVPYVSGSPVTIAIGAGGVPDGNGGDTSWDSGVVLAKGGQGGLVGAGGAGGDAALCIPVIGAFSGGAGGGLGGNSRAGAGGGGAAGPNGVGKLGGQGGAGPVYNGAGGAGAGGGSSLGGANSTTVDPSGPGGDGQDGTPGGLGVSVDGAPGNPGLNGSGGSGGAGNGAGVGGNGGQGGSGIEFDATHGAGGGGGGAGGAVGGNGGNGGTAGLYGGGGGGGGFDAGNGSEGGQGIIVITYTPGATLGITCDSPPDAQISVPYSHFFPVTGDTPPDVWSITAGALPAGLTLNPATGEVSGVPLGPVGDSDFTIQVEDSTEATATADCTITVNAAPPAELSITCDNPPFAFVGVAYSHAFPATGGVPPYSFSISAGALPNGLTLGAGTGICSGIPTLKGVFTFTVQVTDSEEESASVPCSITVRGKCLAE